MNKLMIASVALAALFIANTSSAKVKVSKAEMKAFKTECKDENPGAKKADLKKCVKEKVKAKTAA